MADATCMVSARDYARHFATAPTKASYTIAEAAEQLGISRRSVYNWIRAGILQTTTGVKPNEWRVVAASVDAAMQRALWTRWPKGTSV